MFITYFFCFMLEFHFFCWGRVCVCVCVLKVIKTFYIFSEVNFMWAAHQVHHSSEYYNLTTALRQSVLQIYTSWVTPPLTVQYYLHLQYTCTKHAQKNHRQII